MRSTEVQRSSSRPVEIAALCLSPGRRQFSKYSELTIVGTHYPWSPCRAKIVKKIGARSAQQDWRYSRRRLISNQGNCKGNDPARSDAIAELWRLGRRRRAAPFLVESGNIWHKWLITLFVSHPQGLIFAAHNMERGWTLWARNYPEIVYNNNLRSQFPQSFLSTCSTTFERRLRSAT